MDYRDIIKNIKEKNLEKIYLFYGQEFYLIDNVLNLFKENLDASMIDFNLEVIDGQETVLDKVISSIETLPFMDEKKIVIVKDFELLKGKKKNFTDGDEKIFINHIDNIPDTTVLIFAVHGEIDKRKSLVKQIQKKGLVFNCAKLSDMDLFKWVRKRFVLKEVYIDNAEIMHFIEEQGYKDKNSEKTLVDLENEINKISDFVGKQNKVTKYVIDKLSRNKVENDIFKLIDSIAQKKASDAIKILNDMIHEGESVFGIFSMIARQFKIIMQVRQFQLQGYSRQVIAEKLKMSSYVVGKALSQANNFSDEVIIEIMNSIIESDYKIKNGLIKENLAIEILISKYCKR